MSFYGAHSHGESYVKTDMTVWLILPQGTLTMPLEPKGRLLGGHAMTGGFFFFFCLFRAAPTAYGGSQARGQVRSTAAGLHHSHSNAGSKLHLPPTPQLMTTPDP